MQGGRSKPGPAWRLLTLCVVAGCLGIAPLQAADISQLARLRVAQVEMGMQFKLILYSADETAANRAATSAFDRIHQLNGIMSDYDPASELSRLSDTAGQGRAIKVSDDLWQVLVAAQQLAERSDGAFDVTVGPYVKLWRRARREKEMPPTARMEEARQAVGFRFVKLTEETHTVELLRPGMRLDLGGIGVGYAIDEAMIVLRRHGITQALIDGSGDILVSDAPPGERGWRIGVAPLEAKNGPPSRYLMLKNCAVTTSGDAWQYVELDGKRYSHILDPAHGDRADRSQPGDRRGTQRHRGRQPHQGRRRTGAGPRAGVVSRVSRHGRACAAPVDGKIVQEESSNFRSLE